MTIGIYALYWEEQDLIYIGQSQNIEARYKEHLYKMKNNKHTNYKVQNAFNLYGEPILQLLEECFIEQCNELEIYYTKEFDSINKGLNIVEAGLVRSGPFSRNSVYTKSKVLKVFSLLYKGNNTYSEISNRVKVPKHLVIDIASGRSHKWVSSVYPLEYAQLMGIDWKAKSIELNRIYIGFSHPKYGEISVNNLAKFCREFNLNTGHVSSLVKKRRKTHKGWSLLE